MNIKKLLNNFYYLEDIIPSFLVIKKSCKKIIYHIMRECTGLSIYIQFYFRNRELKKELRFKKDGINLDHYSKVARVLHEEKFGLNNSHYGATKIDWDLFALFKSKRIEKKETIKDGFNKKAIRSTYSFENNKRIMY